MKFRMLSLYFLLLIFLGFQCRKHKDNPQTELPAITQEGKNTFGCKVNGDIWIPHYSCSGLSSNPCGEIYADIFHTAPGQQTFSIQIGASIKYNENSISFFDISTPTSTGILTTGDKIDSISLYYFKPGSIQYSYNPLLYSKGHLVVAKLDTINKIISGTFEAVLYRSLTDSVTITEGRFDLKFAVCKCSQ